MVTCPKKMRAAKKSPSNLQRVVTTLAALSGPLNRLKAILSLFQARNKDALEAAILNRILDRN